MMKLDDDSTYWDGLPLDLRHICIAELNSIDHHYVTGPALKSLISHMYECDSFVFDTTPFDVIKWIDTVFECCLFPLIVHHDDWVKYREEIFMIMNRSSQLIEWVAPQNYKEGYISTEKNLGRRSFVEYWQKLNVYYCVFYMICNDQDALENRLDELLKNTELNVQHLLTEKDAWTYIMQDDWTKEHDLFSDLYEPLNWLSREEIPDGMPKRLYAAVQNRYCSFLDDLEPPVYSARKTLWQLQNNAEKRLLWLCDLIIEEIEESLSDDSLPDPDLIYANDHFETIMMESIYRTNRRKQKSGYEDDVNLRDRV